MVQLELGPENLNNQRHLILGGSSPSYTTYTMTKRAVGGKELNRAKGNAALCNQSCSQLHSPVVVQISDSPHALMAAQQDRVVKQGPIMT
jgi:hypothetical protein